MVFFNTLMTLIAEMKLMHGDELRIRYVGELHKPWSGVGHVIKIPDSILGLCYITLSCIAHLTVLFYFFPNEIIEMKNILFVFVCSCSKSTTNMVLNHEIKFLF